MTSLLTREFSPNSKFDWLTVTDPGFPFGGSAKLIGRGADSRGSYIYKGLYVKMKESGSLGGHGLKMMFL